MENIPHHVVIVPDGNRRWAKARGLLPWEGHEEGAQNVERLIREARDLGIQEISWWGSSLENIKKRPIAEVKALFDVYTKYFKNILTSEEVKEGKVKIRIIGRFREQFPRSLVKLLDKVVEKTKESEGSLLNIFLAYSGDDDMFQAIEKLVASGKGNVTKEDVKDALMTRDLSPVDYLIRTGGDPHLSTGFMMWDTANAELFFTNILFPDFSPEAFRAAIEEYGKRARRGGK